MSQAENGTFNSEAAIGENNGPKSFRVTNKNKLPAIIVDDGDDMVMVMIMIVSGFEGGGQ